MVSTSTNYEVSSFYRIAALKVLLLLIFCILRTTQAEDFVCPPGAIRNLSNAEGNASGFVSAEYGHVFPENKTRLIDGVWRGCICDLEPCLAFCPPDDADVVHDYVNYAAIPRVHDTNGTLDEEANASGPKKWFHISVWDPCTENLKFRLTPDVMKVHLLRDGSLFLPRNKNSLSFGKYCMELRDNEINYTPRGCSPSLLVDEVNQNLENALYIGRIVTVPFIIATIIVYSVVPRLKNIHGITLRCYLGCLAVTNIAIPLDRIRNNAVAEGSWTCLFLGK